MTEPLSQNSPADQPPQTPPVSLAKSHPVLLMTVIGLGVAILVVLALMVGLIIKRVTSTEPKAVTVSDTPQPALTENANALTLPAGATVAEAKIEGGILLIRTTSAGGDEVMAFDPKTGKMLSRIAFKKPAAP